MQEELKKTKKLAREMCNLNSCVKMVYIDEELCLISSRKLGQLRFPQNFYYSNQYITNRGNGEEKMEIRLLFDLHYKVR